jgi:transcriptional regulator with XRE-family HTH domain
MTPFGLKLRELRRRKGVTLTRMATELHVSAAYLSALEHGRRGRPNPGFVMQILGYFDLIWDDAEEMKALARMSNPHVRIDTAGLSPQATELANLLQRRIGTLSAETLQKMLALLTAEEP